MKYKAKQSYKELPHSANMVAFGKASAQERLMVDLAVDFDPPKALLEHLEEEKQAKKAEQAKKADNKKEVK